jgi:phosphatidate cytidylyltransferase
VAGDDERTEGEDLFEDLDKFFAPIQDVDWPEHSPTPSRGAGPDVQPERGPTVASGAVDEVVRLEEEEPEVPAPEVPAPEAPEPVAPAPEDRPSFEEGRTETAPGAAPEVAEELVGSLLFESEADEYGELGQQEPSSSTPTGYVELPGQDAKEEGVAELIEETDAEGAVETTVEATDEAPDIEAVEAAAEHFAESVREEVRVEPEVEPEPPVAPTEEVAIAELLGEEEAEAFAEPEPSRTVRVGAEGLGGPSWQEPSAIEVGAEQERGPGRNVPTAFLTGLILAALAVGALLIGPGAFAILAGVVVLFALGEFYLAMQKQHHQPATALGLVSGALVLGAGYYRGENAMLAIMALAIFATFLWFMTVPAPHRRDVVPNVAITILGIAYIPLLAAYALAVLKLPDGEGLTLAIIGLTFVYDTAAFGVGYFWGSRPLAPNISPKKSWEGAIGATLVVIAVAVGIVAPTVTLLDTVGRSVGLAVVVAIFAPLGDLAESLLKRDLGIKDMGGILPGHGGVMDRIDSVLFVAPAAFIYLRLILL